MPEVNEHVQEFREVVDHVIARQVESEPGVSWSDYDREAKAVGLTFESRPAGDSRIVGPYGHNDEHRWAVSIAPLRHTHKYVGRLSVISFESQPEMLYRHWDLNSAMQINILTTRPITSLELTRNAVKWIRSPHLYDDVLNQLAVLEADEQEEVDSHLAELSGTAGKLNEDLANIARSRRNAWRDAPDTRIY